MKLSKELPCVLKVDVSRTLHTQNELEEKSLDVYSRSVDNEGVNWNKLNLIGCLH